MNISAKIQKIDTRIKEIKKEIAKLGDLRPGTMSEQWSVCGKKYCACRNLEKPRKHGPYWQVSYFHKGKSRTEFIRHEMAHATIVQTQNYKWLKRLVDEWVVLGLRRAHLIYRTTSKKQR
jgi:hypothetical protein